MRRVLLLMASVSALAGPAHAATARRAPPPSGLPTPERLLKMWENADGGDVATQALDRAFPDEMRRIAVTVLAKVRAGGSAERAMADASEARADLLRDNLWLARMAPDENLLAYADVLGGLMQAERARRPSACAAIGMGGASTRTVGKPVQRMIAEQVALIEAGRAHPVRRPVRDTGDLAAALKVSQSHGASQSDIGAFASGAMASLTDVDRCRIAIALVSSLRDLPTPTAARLVASMLGDNTPGGPDRLATPEDMVADLKRNPNLGPAITLLATEMPDTVNALAAAATERLKSGDVQGSDEQIAAAFNKLLADNIDAMIAAPADKLVAAEKAILRSDEAAMAASQRCGVDPAQVAGLPAAQAYQQARAELLRALVDAVLSGRRALAAGGAGATALVLAPTHEDQRALLAEIKRIARDPVASQALAEGSVDRQTPAVVCSANALLSRAILDLPGGPQTRLTAAFLKDAYGPKPH